MIAKCGALVEWHWAHVVGGDCDPWSEAETPWHRWWKERAPLERREVVLGDSVKHRADIQREDGYVIELQHSPLSVAEIHEREAFYKRMVWLIDGRTLNRPTFLFDTLVRNLHELRPGVWRWIWPRRSFRFARKKIFIDLGQSVIEVERFDHVPKSAVARAAAGFYVHGTEMSRAQFLARAHLADVPTSHEVVSYLVEWRAEATRSSEEHDEVGPAGRIRGRGLVGRSSLRRREFRTAAGLQRWHFAKSRKDLSVLAWLVDGSLWELGGDAEVAQLSELL